MQKSCFIMAIRADTRSFFVCFLFFVFINDKIIVPKLTCRLSTITTVDEWRSSYFILKSQTKSIIIPKFTEYYVCSVFPERVPSPPYQLRTSRTFTLRTILIKRVSKALRMRIRNEHRPTENSIRFDAARARRLSPRRATTV